MQPYFFPYLGYFSLMASCDKFVIFDDVQYIKNGWINRNRIAGHQSPGWGYITVPVKNQSYKSLINQTRISDQFAWKKRILNQLNVYKPISKYFYETLELVEEILSVETDFLSELNIHALTHLNAYLDLNTDIALSSDLRSKVPLAESPGNHGLLFCQLLGFQNYKNAPGAIDEIFDFQAYVEAGINLFAIENIAAKDRGDGLNSLSIIHELFVNGHAKTRERILNYELIRKTPVVTV